MTETSRCRRYGEQVWLHDIKLPLDMTLTLEGMYTKDINAIVQRNINMPTPYVQHRITAPTNDPFGQPQGRKIYSNLSEAMLLTNTDKGYSGL
jgi:hypothetical protein